MEWYRGKVLDPLVDGVTVQIKGQRFVIPEFQGLTYERAIPHFNELQKAVDVKGPDGIVIQPGDQMVAMRARRMIATIILGINYPEITADQVGTYCKLEDINAVIEAAAEARRLASGDAGEVLAGAEKPALN